MCFQVHYLIKRSLCYYLKEHLALNAAMVFTLLSEVSSKCPASYLFLCKQSHPRTQHCGSAALTHDGLAVLAVLGNQAGPIRASYGQLILVHL